MEEEKEEERERRREKEKERDGERTTEKDRRREKRDRFGGRPVPRSVLVARPGAGRGGAGGSRPRLAPELVRRVRGRRRMDGGRIGKAKAPTSQPGLSPPFEPCLQALCPGGSACIRYVLWCRGWEYEGGRGGDGRPSAARLDGRASQARSSQGRWHAQDAPSAAPHASATPASLPAARCLLPAPSSLAACLPSPAVQATCGERGRPGG
ncbi:hypothetical protein CDD83_1402 [Cordyceps sp. RAO-2017]|nr:hypothetical protein CDD83_1402 [Cordyceps sp. RAO-2017]